MATYISCPSCINGHRLTILLTTDKREQVAHALQFQEKYLRIFIMKNRVDNFFMKKDAIFIVPTKKKHTAFSTGFTIEDTEIYLCITNT